MIEYYIIIFFFHYLSLKVYRYAEEVHDALCSHSGHLDYYWWHKIDTQYSESEKHPYAQLSQEAFHRRDIEAWFYFRKVKAHFWAVQVSVIINLIFTSPHSALMCLIRPDNLLEYEHTYGLMSIVAGSVLAIIPLALFILSVAYMARKLRKWERPKIFS